MIRRAASLLFLLFLPPAASAADISVHFYDPVGLPTARPGQNHRLTVVVQNRTEEAVNVRLRLTFDPVIVIEEWQHFDEGWRCEAQAGRFDCTNPYVTSGATPSINLRLRMPATPAGGDYRFEAVATSTPEDSNPSNNTASTIVHVIRQHIVSNTNDAGPGSLRNAIEEANDWCTPQRPCDIKFRFPEGPVPVIEPLTPLPPLTACGAVVGDWPESFQHPAPVQVEINGRRVASGPGLELRSSCTFPSAYLFGVAIKGFPGDGILITGLTYYMLRGFVVTENGGRGINHRVNLQLTLYDVVIGANARSGIAVFDGSVGVYKSRIGVGVDGSDLANGASGIYIAPTAWDVYLDDTIVANNHHFGLALAGKRFVNFTGSTVIKDNTADIDWMLDGPSSSVDRQYVPKTPRIVSVTYDAPANQTRVTVAVDDPQLTAGSNAEVVLYASDRITIFGTAHLTKRVGAQWLEWQKPVPEAITINVDGDLRGQYVSAITTRWTVQPYIDTPSPSMASTSEVSVAVRVE